MYSSRGRGRGAPPSGKYVPRGAPIPQPQTASLPYSVAPDAVTPGAASTSAPAAQTPYREAQQFWAHKDLRALIHAERALLHAVAPLQTKDGQPVLHPLPALLHSRYHSLLPLRTAEMSAAQQGPGYAYSRHPVYKAVDAESGDMVLVRRISGVRPQSEVQLFPVLEFWRSLVHPNVVHMRDAFLTSDFGEQSQPGMLDLCLVYEMHPLARSLQEVFLPSPGMASLVTATNTGAAASSSTTSPNLPPAQPGATASGSSSTVNGPLMPPSEDLLWTIACQLVSAVRAIHFHGGACRLLCPSKVIVSMEPVAPPRVCISCAGFGDLFAPNKGFSVPDAQREDLVQLGTTLLSIATGINAGAEAVHAAGGSREQYSKVVADCLERMRRDYSQQLFDFVLSLVSSRFSSVFEVTHVVADRMVMYADAMTAAVDRRRVDLSREIENGRLFRLITKMSMVTERAEHAGDAQWSETGDRYLVKLFRDYVFHQCDENGHPIVDLGHVTECLNKLDVSADEKVLMMSRDGQNLLVASFADLKRSFDNAFADLVQNSR